jgi:hypothetical protein
MGHGRDSERLSHNHAATFTYPILPSPPSPSATDGLWDVMSSQAAVDYVTENLIRAGILTSRAEQSEERSVLEKREPSRGE